MIIKLRNRLVFTMMLFVSVILFMAFLAIYLVTDTRIRNENTVKINSEETIQISSDNTTVMLEGETMENTVIIDRISPAIGIYFNVIVDADGNLIYTNSALDLSQEQYVLAASIAMQNQDGGIAVFGERTWQYITNQDSIELSGFPAVEQGDGLTLIRFLDITDSVQMLETLQFTLIGLYVVLLLIFSFLSYCLANRSVKPMARAWEHQRQFIADASHELKTPISTLNANLDVLYASKEDTIENQIKWLDNSKQVLMRMTALIQRLLELAKLDEVGETVQAFEKFPISQLLEESVDSFRWLAAKKSIRMTQDSSSDIFVRSDYNQMQQVVEILLDNAVKYTPEGGEIQVFVKAHRSGLAITIRNTGDGISPLEISKIFDRFYRGNQSRTYEEGTFGGSYGLGLSIAKTYTESLGGKLTVQSDAGWTSFVLRFPVKKLIS